MHKTHRRSLNCLSALASILPFFAPLSLGVVAAEYVPIDETDEEKKKREEKEKEEAAQKKAEDEKKKKEEEDAAEAAKAKGTKPPLSACLAGALSALKGGTPALSAAALTAEQSAHATTRATLASAQADLTAARASVASSQLALAAVASFFGLAPSSITGLSAAQVHGVLQTKISGAAIEIVASIGLDPSRAPTATGGDGAASTRAELHQAYAAIKDPKAAAAFYAKNEKALLGD